jgi:hypothetical protein
MQLNRRVIYSLNRANRELALRQNPNKLMV